MISSAPRLAASFVCASLCLAPLPSRAGAPEPEQSIDESQVAEPPPPSVDPQIGLPPGEGAEEDGEKGIEFAVPPPELESEDVEEEPVPTPISFPDPGMAPNDGASMLVLGGTTVALTLAGSATGLVVGLRRGTPLEWLLPSIIVPTVGLLAFGGYGLGVGIKRAVDYRRWEIGYRVIGMPQGGGLQIAGGFALLGAVGFGSVGVFALRDGYTELGASLLAIGVASGVAMPIMFVVGARRARAYQRTGGWRRRPVPPLPPGAESAQRAVRVAPFLVPLRGGAMFGASGFF